MPRKRLKSAAAATTDLELAKPAGPDILNFPLELRLEIYSYLKVPRKTWKAHALYHRRQTRQTSRTTKNDNNERLDRKSPGFASSHSFSLSILLTNKAIHAEASDVLYRNIDWHFFVADSKEGGRQAPSYFAQLPCLPYVQRITLNMCWRNVQQVSQKDVSYDIYPVCNMLAKLPLQAINVALTHCQGLDFWPSRAECLVKPLLKLPRAEKGVEWKILEYEMMYECSWCGLHRLVWSQVQNRELFWKKFEEMMGWEVERVKMEQALLNPLFTNDHW